MSNNFYDPLTMMMLMMVMMGAAAELTMMARVQKCGEIIY